jgi:heme a synthase
VGALNVWYVFPEPLTVSHTAIASGIWFTLSAAVFLSFYSPVAERALSYRGTVEVPA